MIKIYQETETDCVRACLASVLEMELAAVPELDMNDWYNAANNWLDLFGLSLVNVHTNKSFPFDAKVYSIAGLKLRDRQHYHAVVMLGKEIVHDPWPAAVDGAQIIGVKEQAFFVIHDPFLYVQYLMEKMRK